MKLASLLVLAGSLAVASAAEGLYTYDEDSTTLVPPDRWFELAGASACAGESQSPIALVKSTAAVCNKPPFIFNGGNCKVGNIVVSPNPGNWGDVSFNTGCQGPSLQLGSKAYNFKALHLHSLAEHGIGADGTLTDAELHLVHVNANDANDLLVIGIFLRAKNDGLLGSLLDTLANLTGLPLYVSTACNAAIAAIFGKIAAATGGPAYSGNNNALLNIYNLIPSSNGYLTYPGSLTTPVCSEIVTWIVAEQLVKISTDQLQQYRNGLAGVPGSLVSDAGNNNRPLQALNGRTVEYCQF